MTQLTTLEICAGAGGQALGLERAGFEHAAAVEIDAHACATLRLNRPAWHVFEGDVREVNGKNWKGVDVLAGGVPCPPFSVAGKRLGKDDERDLFPEVLRLASEIRPAVVMIENVRGLMGAKFEEYRREILVDLAKLGYSADWRLVNAVWFGVPQHRERSLLVAFRGGIPSSFIWPEPGTAEPATVGETLRDLMQQGGWKGARAWSKNANKPGPTVVGGSKKHGGPDLGPTRARKQWADLGVDGLGIANHPPGPDHEGMPRLTLRMVARIQGFPDDWAFSGGKTHAYRQVGNAFPPPCAAAMGAAILKAMKSRARTRVGAA